jgi:hypothetical protein
MKLKDHNLIAGFIEMCHSFPCLWKRTDPHYHNTVRRENTYRILLEKYNEYDPNATKQSVLKEINSWHFAYNKEYKKIKESEHSDVGTDDIYSQLLCYYCFYCVF